MTRTYLHDWWRYAKSSHMTNLLIGAEEAAEIMGLTVNGLRARVASGKLRPAAAIGRRAVQVFFRSEIERLAELEEHNTKTA